MTTIKFGSGRRPPTAPPTESTTSTTNTAVQNLPEEKKTSSLDAMEPREANSDVESREQELNELRAATKDAGPIPTGFSLFGNFGHGDNLFKQISRAITGAETSEAAQANKDNAPITDALQEFVGSNSPAQK